MINSHEIRNSFSTMFNPLSTCANGMAYAIHDKKYNRVISIQSQTSWRKKIHILDPNKDLFFKVFTKAKRNSNITPEISSAFDDKITSIEMQKRQCHGTQYPFIMVRPIDDIINIVFTIYCKKSEASYLIENYQKEILSINSRLTYEILPHLLFKNNDINKSIYDKLEQSIQYSLEKSLHHQQENEVKKCLTELVVF